MVRGRKVPRHCFCGGDPVVLYSSNTGPWCVACLRNEVERLGLKFAMELMHPVVNGMFAEPAITVGECLAGLA